MRSFTMEVTRGMLNQCLVSLDKQVRKGVFYPYETVSINFKDTRATVSTTVETSTRFRERSAFGQLFRVKNAKEGDTLAFSETSPGVFEIEHFRTESIPARKMANIAESDNLQKFRAANRLNVTRKLLGKVRQLRTVSR